MRSSAWLAAALAVVLFGLCGRAWAGPPFRTDDPEPVPWRHWEVYIASTGFYSHLLGGFSTLPHVEVNYGPVPGVQLHMIAPMVISAPAGGPRAYGYGDTELGMKVRFHDQTKYLPEVGTFPLVEAPSGDAARGLGAGYTQVFIPIWLQKDWGGKPDDPAWTSYGGGGWWRNPGPGNRNWFFFGWELQRNLSDKLMIGGEVFHEGANTTAPGGGTGFNLGGQINFSEHRHLLYSAGLDNQSGRSFIWYGAYQWTF